MPDGHKESFVVYNIMLEYFPLKRAFLADVTICSTEIITCMYDSPLKAAKITGEKAPQLAPPSHLTSRSIISVIGLARLSLT
jgi:hypothetical protein